MKRCPNCDTQKPIQDYGKCRTRKDGHQNCCKKCQATRMRAWMVKKTEDNPDYTKDRRLRAWYRISYDQYKEMLEKQGGVCYVCGGDPMGKGIFHVDHDHRCCPTKRTCGKCTRALLCHKCNVALGMVLDSTETLYQLIAYLEEFEEVN